MAENKDEAVGRLHPNLESDNKSTDAYKNLSRGLTPEELTQSGTQKLILNDLAKAESRVRDLEPFRDSFFKILTEKNVLEERLSKTTKSEVLYSFCITTGGIIVGLSKIFYEKDGDVCAIMIVIGGLLIIGGVLFKVRFKK
jgi:hypothetical protein